MNTRPEPLEITYGFCTRCGKKLIHVEEETGKYFRSSGKKVMKHLVYCPEFDLDKRSAVMAYLFPIRHTFDVYEGESEE